MYASAILRINPDAPSRTTLLRHSPRAICTKGLDPRDPLLRSGRAQGFSADLFDGRARWKDPKLSFIKDERKAGVFCGFCVRKGEVLAYVEQNRNLHDLKDPAFMKDMLGDGMGCQNQSEYLYLNQSKHSEF